MLSPVVSALHAVASPLQVLSALSDALADLQQLAQLLLIGTQMTSGTAETVEAAPALAAQQASLPQLSKDISTITTSQSAEGKDPDVELPLHSASAGRKSLSGHLPRKTKAVAESRPALLACSIAHNLQVAQQLLPASKRERYVGSIGSYRCAAVRVVIVVDMALICHCHNDNW